MSKEQCDLVETQDLLDFQHFTTLIKTYGASSYRVPNVTGTGVPLSTILAAHHNLVTYSVPFEWTRSKRNEKRYYSPEAAVRNLANGRLFSDDSVVQKWFKKNRGTLEPTVIAGFPGMSAWVRLAKACFAVEGGTERCTKYPNWYDKWNATHAIV